MPLFAQSVEWSSLSDYRRDLIAYVMPPSGGLWDDDVIHAFVSKNGTRSSTYIAVGLLLRNEGTDHENARALLETLLSLQIVAPEHKLYGGWPTSPDPARNRDDANWREFVSTGLIVALETFPDALDQSLKEGIRVALKHAARGAVARNVGAGYTNIALMSAFLMDYVGHYAPDTGFRERGVEKAQEVFALFSKHGTFNEFNSPTYYGTDLLALSLWRKLAKSAELRTWGASMEADLWREIGRFYHAGLMNMSGPYARSYGMDMTHYTALTGLCIAMVLDRADGAPIPPEGQPRASYEWAYTPLFAILGLQVPEDVLPHLHGFMNPRQVTRSFEDRKRVHQAQALLEPHWMMGAATGLDRQWEQRCPATVHWGDATQVNWLLVHGTSGTEARIESRGLVVTVSHSDDAHPLRLLIQADGATLEMIDGDIWHLPGMAFGVRSPLGKPHVTWVTEKPFGRVLDVSWSVPAGWDVSKTVLILTPMPR